ncbi:Uncharacterised protein [Escherichia coli]|uniref:Uncharacterized protein n=1 Tax=Escherichia coli TaxID=562 RepID=A0A2X3M154_ECOLX|nr:Uncharacterised protein [Escherichia coli]
MFSTGDDIVLCVWRERGEEGGIARDTHYQIAVLIRMFFRLQQRFAGNDVVLNMQPLCTSKKVRSRIISFCLSDSFSSVAGFSFWLSNTPPRIAAVGSLPTEPMTAVGPRWSVPEAGLAPSASGVWALRRPVLP